MTVAAADPTLALGLYLKGQLASIEERAWHGKVPDAEVPSMPRAAILVKIAGGYAGYGSGELPLGDPRLDIVCYGSKDLEAQQIGREVVLALKDLTRQVIGGTILYSAQVEVGPVPVADPNTQWPQCVVSARILHAEAKQA